MAERFAIPGDLARAAVSEGRDYWATRMARLLDLDLNRILRWLFARAVEASPYWAGMADLARTLCSFAT